MSLAYEFLPWHADTAKQWLANKERFAHAWLVHGMAGIGQQQFVLASAYSLLCESPVANLACGKCNACNWIANGNHPDLRCIRSEARMLVEGFEIDSKKSPSNEIKIEQIRSLQPWFNTATHRGGLRVAVLYYAEELNPMAANALLKILEEPPANTVFLIAANSPDSLLPTIVSRCRRIPLAKPSLDVSLAWLSQQGLDHVDMRLTANGGAPINALITAEQQAIPDWIHSLVDMLLSQQLNAGDLADLLANNTNEQWLDQAQRLWFDMVLGCFDMDAYYYPSLNNKIKTVIKKSDVNKLMDLQKWFIEMKPLAKHPLNAKLLFDTAANKLLKSAS